MKFFVDASYESLFHYGEELCGDKVEIVRTDDFFLAVLADGLGSGVKANILSTLTSKIIATMLSNGSSLTDAIETIASTLPVCSERGIAYSTFTIVKIDVRGVVTIVEFDNPLAVVFRDNVLFYDTDRKEQIVGGKQIYTSKFMSKPDDMIVVFSDGVVHAGVGRLLDLGWQYDNIVNYLAENIKPNMSPRALNKRLLGSVNTLYMDKPGDDSTVCSMRIKESTPLTVMVGPPNNKEMDKVVVDKLMYSKGLKVVCGGTTSQIVSKVTGKEVDVMIDYENPAVPPIAHISGIDLVTEGVLTIGKTLEIMKAYIADTNGEAGFMLNKTDGATKLCKMLLEDCTEVRFLVGQAINPAHQNPGMPASLGLKFTLISDLAKVLESTGKKVTVEFF